MYLQWLRAWTSKKEHECAITGTVEIERKEPERIGSENKTNSGECEPSKKKFCVHTPFFH
jgi:hypothetical protein